MSITYTTAGRKKICEYSLKHGKTRCNYVFNKILHLRMLYVIIYMPHNSIDKSAWIRLYAQSGTKAYVSVRIS